MKAFVWAGVALAMGAVGCGAEDIYGLSITSQSPVTAKAATCSFAILTTVPNRPFEEIAILDSGSANAGSIDAEDFKHDVGKLVCEVGGDAVIGEINGLGRYVRGTVIRWKATPAPAPSSSPP